jgi:hypothetical protein
VSSPSKYPNPRSSAVRTLLNLNARGTHPVSAATSVRGLPTYSGMQRKFTLRDGLEETIGWYLEPVRKARGRK